MSGIISESYRIAVKIKSLFIRIDIQYLLNEFISEKYVPLVPYPNVETLNDSFVVFNGTILKRGKITIDVDTKLNTVGMMSNSVNDILENFDMFLRIITDMLFNQNLIWFNEFHAKIEFAGDYDYNSIFLSRNSKVVSLQNLFSKLSKDMNNSSIRLWSNYNPDSSSFVEVKMEPDSLYNKGIVYKIIYRDENVESFKDNIMYIAQNKSKLADIL